MCRHNSYYLGMSQALYPPASPQSIGQVLDTAFRIFQVSLVKCLPHGILSMIAGQLPNIYSLAIGKPMERFGGGDPVWWALYAVGSLASIGLWSAMLLRQRSIITLQPAHARAELFEALRRIPALVVLGVLVVVAVAGGLVALLIPGLYLMTALILAWPAAMLDGHGPMNAIRQSLRLVKGDWWRVSAIFTVAFVVALVFYITVFAFVAILLPLFGANDLAMLTAASVVVVIALGAVGVPFYGAVLLAVYGDLNTRKAGGDSPQNSAAARQG